MLCFMKSIHIHFTPQRFVFYVLSNIVYVIIRPHDYVQVLLAISQVFSNTARRGRPILKR